MNGEQLYAAYCAALWVDWPQQRGTYAITFDSVPASPVAWPFLAPALQSGWNNLADALEGTS